MSNQRLARELNSQIKVAQPAQQNLSGSATYVGQIIPTAPPLSSLTYTLTNATSAAVKYIIGDATGLIAASIGGTLVSPTKLNGATGIVAANKLMTGYAPIGFGSMIFKATSSADQFNNIPKAYVVNHAGNLSSSDIDLASAATNVAQNAKILTLNCSIKLDASRAIVVDVDASETLAITMKPAGYKQG